MDGSGSRTRMILLLCGLAISVVFSGCQFFGGTAVEPKPFHAYAWQLGDLNSSLPWTPSPYPNLTHFYWIDQSYTNDSRSGRNPDANLRHAALRVKEATDQMPQGHRVIFDWDNNHLLWKTPEDMITDANGGKFILWWDNGAKRVAERMDNFFRAYKEAGGQLDVFVLDFEHGVGGSGVGGGQEDIWLGKPERVAAVKDTPRFKEMMKTIKVDDPSYFYDQKFHPPVKWTAYARELTRKYINQAYYEPIRKYFPDVKFSNYGDYCDDFCTPIPNGTPADPGEGIPGRHGGYAGTHQATDGLYGTVGSITQSWAKPVEGKKVISTPFNACLLHTNLMRTTILSDPAPVSPWIAWRGYDGFGFMPPGQIPMVNTDYFQELIYHTALCNPDYFIFWSAFRFKPDVKPETFCMKSDCQFVNDLLDEINGLAGYSDRATLVERLAPWHQGYLLSGIYANGRNLWRLTPDLGAVKSVQECLAGENPPVFQIAGTRIEFPGGKIIRQEKPLSANGFWIETSAGTRPVITTSAATR